MTLPKKKKKVTKKGRNSTKAITSDTSNKSIYSKQNIKKKLNEFGDFDAL
ncbi:hypothetical protein [Flavobacterium macrobrachii]|jgi:hypothetical protein